MELLKLVCTQNQCKGNGLQYIGVLKCPFCTTSLSPDLSIIKTDVLRNAVTSFPAHITVPAFQLFATPSYYKLLH